MNDYIWDGIDAESRTEIESKYTELAFAVGRAVAKNSKEGSVGSLDFQQRCVTLLHRLIYCEPLPLAPKVK